MVRPIEKNSVNQTDSGFARISIGRATHDKLKIRAAENGTTIAALIRDIAETGSMQSTFINNPMNKVNKSLQETRSLARMAAALVVLGSPASWVEELRKPGSIMEEILPEARLEANEFIDQCLVMAKRLKNRQVQPQFDMNLGLQNGEVSNV